MGFTILDNGVEILDLTFKSLAVAESFFHDSVINLGSNLGPDIDLTFGYGSCKFHTRQSLTLSSRLYAQEISFSMRATTACISSGPQACVSAGSRNTREGSRASK